MPKRFPTAVAESLASAKMVIVTEYTTVYPTNIAQITAAPTPSSTLDQAPTTATSSLPDLTRSTPDSTTSLSSAVMSPPTMIPTNLVTDIPLFPMKEYDATFAYITLVAIIALAVLLIVMISYQIYLRFKGECTKCRSMKRQLSKWESGELIRITPLMVRKREALNKAAAAASQASKADIETGMFKSELSRAETIDEYEAGKKPSLFQKIKAKVLGNGHSSVQTPDPPADGEVDRFFTIKQETAIDHPHPSHSTTTQLPQADYNGDYLYATRYSTYPASSRCSPTTDVDRTDANESRVFSDVSISDMSSIRRPLRNDLDESKRYNAYTPANHDAYDSCQKAHNIAIALAKLESREYKEAESVLARASARDSEMRRAMSVVNLRDQQLNVARHPNVYTEAGLPPEQASAYDVRARPESYQMFDWRKKGLRPPDLT